MNNIILFKSKKQITAENNYNEFINFAAIKYQDSPKLRIGNNMSGKGM